MLGMPSMMNRERPLHRGADVGAEAPAPTTVRKVDRWQGLFHLTRTGR